MDGVDKAGVAELIISTMATSSTTSTTSTPSTPGALLRELEAFDRFGKTTARSTLNAGPAGEVPVLINEFWTARQRAAHSLHEISYRACFKPQLPRFFIERLTRPGELGP